ncbi:chemotaxis sensory transducer, Cache sensor [Pseudomonas mandelii JR-1]|uniref:Chemotaxis sensory transducer, Cache sensor n=1 Tax=Pseudomonas mandelii JR-1 TaxID=1147786 RepID=A0A024EC76_9PSED|nr:chemotaxis sensory transducer, Cache sensor [Pseudomonas mandelii JR-1]
MAELEIHFMGLLMQKVGMRSRCNIPCNSAGGILRSRYFGARMSH